MNVHHILMRNFETFANRLGNVPYAWQSRLFDFFLETYRMLVESAKADGTYNPGVQDLCSLGAQRASRTALAVATSRGSCGSARSDYRKSLS